MYDTLKFIDKSRLIHNDTYDYSLVEYIQSDQHVKIICKRHGVFSQQARAHMNGRGCPECSMQTFTVKTRLPFYKKFKEDFLNSEACIHLTCQFSSFKRKSDLMNFKCSRHGFFKALPYTAIKNGCKKCNLENERLSIMRANIENYYGINKAYDVTSVSKNGLYYTLSCKKHGSLNIHKNTIYRKDRDYKYPCPECRKENKKHSHKGRDFFIKKSIEKHGYRYDYSLSEYKGVDSRVLIRCKKHGFFTQRAGSHTTGSGCPECSIDSQLKKAVRSEAERIKRRKHKKHRHRARKYGCYYEPVSDIKVFKRDKWKCKVCGRKVQKQRIYDDDAAELGHIIPMSLKGAHSYTNVQCECRACNMKKRARVENEQMTIFCNYET